jgi:hypothetical protein
MDYKRCGIVVSLLSEIVVWKTAYRVSVVEPLPNVWEALGSVLNTAKTKTKYNNNNDKKPIGWKIILHMEACVHMCIMRNYPKSFSG